MTEPNYHGWHLRKELNISHLLMTVGLLVGLIGWGSTLDNRVTTVEVRLDHVQKSQDVMREDAKEAQAEVLQELRAIRERIDQMAERITR
ncbi:MAG: hypothetical protein R3330_09760 [Saprospiraceae bacterium]|nr:hypothetical protein [Saprospiraceae bacterium]